MAIMDTLRDCELFRNLGLDDLRKIAPYCYDESYRKDTTIFKEGDEAKELYILTEGRVVLEMDRPVPHRPIIPIAVEVISRSEICGWSALVDPYKYTLSARCMVPSIVLAINGEMFRRIMGVDDKLGHIVMHRLAKIISTRLSYTRQRLTNGFGVALLEREIQTSK